MAALAKAWEKSWSHPPVQATLLDVSSARKAGRERKQKEQVADLRNRRIGDQQLQTLLAQRQHAAEQDGPRAQVASSCAAAALSRPGMASNQSRTIKKNEPLTTSADSTALPGAGAPAWAGGSHRCSGKSAVLASNPTVIRAAAIQATGSGTHALGQQSNVERAVGAVEQRRPQQIEHRAEQREQQIAQRRPDGLRATLQADERHGGKGQQLQRDVEVEKVAAERRQR